MGRATRVYPVWVSRLFLQNPVKPHGRLYICAIPRYSYHHPLSFGFYMNDAQLIQMIQQGGAPRERANRYLQDKFFYLIRQLGVRQLHLNYEDAHMAFTDALAKLDWKIRNGESIDDLGKMLYTLAHRRGVDIIRDRTTKESDPLDKPTTNTGLPDWLVDILQNLDSDHVLNRLLETDDENERLQRQKRILACILKGLDQMPPKRRALLVNKLDGYDYEELKQLHGFKTERVAHEMVSRGLESLREALKTLCQQGEPICRDLCAWLNRKAQL